MSVARAPAWALGLILAALASVPALYVGFVGDDLVQRAMLEGRWPGPTSWLGLYDWTPSSSATRPLLEQGPWPWFTDPDLELRFLRPVTSASLALDAWLFGRNAALAHAHSVLWLLLLTASSAKLYERWFTPPAARLSVAALALAGAHAQPTAWLAARHTLLGAALGASALWLWLRYREDGWKPGRYLAPSCLMASLLASESALVACALLVGYELATRGLRRGARGVLLFGAVALTYVGLYALLGYGGRGSGLYVSPFEAPARYLALGAGRVGVLAAELLLAMPADVVSFVDSVRGPIITAAAVAACVCAALLSRSRELTSLARRSLAWLSLATFVSLWTLVGTTATGRVLPLASLGAAAVVGNVLWLAWRAARTSTRPRRALAALALVCVGFLHFGLAPSFRTLTAVRLRAIASAQRDLAVDADVGACADRGYLYLLTGSDPALALFAGLALEFYAPEKAGAERFRVLSLAPQAQRLSRVAHDAFELDVASPPRKINPFEALLRSPEHPLVPGQRILLEEMTAVVELAEGMAVSRARFELNHDLDAGRVCLMAWRAGRLQAVPIPPLGETTLIAHEPGPMGM